jgi:transposase InsO family protein
VLTRKKRWGKSDLEEESTEREDFECIRGVMAEQLKLALPDWSREFIVKSDWSKAAMGVVLLQRGVEGKLRPIMFASRKCTNAEGNASAPDGEMLALVYAIQKFEKYLMGRKFSAYVDQGSLGWLKDRALSSVNNRRLQAAFAYLRQFRFDLFYRPAQDMQDADALSRVKHAQAETGAAKRTAEVAATEQAPQGMVEVRVWRKSNTTDQKPISVAPAEQLDKDQDLPLPAQVEMEGVWGFNTELRSIDELQKTDDEVIAIRNLMRGRALQDQEIVPTARQAMAQYLSRDPACTNFVEGIDGKLYHLEMVKGKQVRQLVVPVACRGRLVVTKHAAQGHRSGEEVLAKLRKHYFWPTMRADVFAWIGGCGCTKKKAERKRPIGRLQSLKVQRPGQKMLFDIFGPLPPSEQGNVYILVLMDVGTREVMLEALPTKEAKGIAKAMLERVYLRGMCPEVWQSDQAKEFVGKVMSELAALLGAEFRHSSPYRPQTNAHVERFNKTLATHLSLMLKRQDQRDWDQYLKHVEYAQLVGAQSALGRVSPLFLKGGWEALDPTDVAMGVADVQTKDRMLGEWMADLQRARQLAMQSQELALARQAELEGKRRIIKRDVDVGDIVWVMFPNVGMGKSRKLAFRMHGPYKLKRWLHGGRRVAVVGHESELQDEIVVHVDRMVRKKDVPQKLIRQWKPIKLQFAMPERRTKGTGEKEQKKAIDARKKQPKEVKEDLRRATEDESLEIDHIVSKSLALDDDGRDGWQYRVRFVGFGPEADEFYWEDDIIETAPEVLKDFNERWDKNPHNA